MNSRPQYLDIWIIIFSFCVTSNPQYFSEFKSQVFMCIWSAGRKCTLFLSVVSWHHFRSHPISQQEGEEKGSNRSRLLLRRNKSSHFQRLHEYERQHDFVKDLTEVIFPKHPKSYLYKEWYLHFGATTHHNDICLNHQEEQIYFWTTYRIGWEKQILLMESKENHLTKMKIKKITSQKIKNVGKVCVGTVGSQTL